MFRGIDKKLYHTIATKWVADSSNMLTGFSESGSHSIPCSDLLKLAITLHPDPEFKEIEDPEQLAATESKLETLIYQKTGAEIKKELSTLERAVELSDFCSKSKSSYHYWTIDLTTNRLLEIRKSILCSLDDKHYAVINLTSEDKRLLAKGLIEKVKKTTSIPALILLYKKHVDSIIFTTRRHALVDEIKSKISGPQYTLLTTNFINAVQTAALELLRPYGENVTGIQKEIQQLNSSIFGIKHVKNKVNAEKTLDFQKRYISSGLVFKLYF